MKKTVLLLAVILGLVTGYAQNYTLDDQVYDYIDQYKDLAMQEMEQYRIPASITLAQAIYSSKIGMNRVAKEANNHFGIMCHTSEWTGETFYETENHSSDYCYRKYASVKESYRDHSLFLSQRSRYVKLFYYPITDYKSWAIGLKEAGYSGNPRYADTLISIIEKYYLMHYDRKVALKIGDTTALQAMTAPQPERATNTTTTPISYTTTATSQPSTIKSAQTPEDQAPKTQPVAAQTTPPAQQQPSAKSKQDTLQVNGIDVIVNKKEQPKTVKYDTIVTTLPAPEKVGGKNVFVLDPYSVPFKVAYYPYTSRPTYENNKTKFIIAKAGDTYKKLAESLQLTEKNLRLYNDVYDDSEPIEDEVVYVEMKSTKSPVEFHTLAAGDTYRYIAQKYGIQLKIIIKRNSGAISNYGVGDQICIGCK
ncbi:MAG: glucosaminidase domain-containing protein [Bacteroidales bacterium]|nr:glucosaminidase domain-containing protein [Bacteroidales bacterium]